MGTEARQADTRMRPGVALAAHAAHSAVNPLPPLWRLSADPLSHRSILATQRTGDVPAVRLAAILRERLACKSVAASRAALHSAASASSGR